MAEATTMTDAEAWDATDDARAMVKEAVEKVEAVRAYLFEAVPFTPGTINADYRVQAAETALRAALNFLEEELKKEAT